jgi:hypothetical protein
MSSDQQQQQQQAEPAAPPAFQHPFVTGSLKGVTGTSPSMAPGQASSTVAATAASLLVQDNTASTLTAALPAPVLAAPVLPAVASVSASVNVNPPSEKKIPPVAAAAIAIAPPLANPPTVIPNDDDNEATPIQPSADKDDAVAVPMEVETSIVYIPPPKQRKRGKYSTTGQNRTELMVIG